MRTAMATSPASTARTRRAASLEDQNGTPGAGRAPREKQARAAGGDERTGQERDESASRARRRPEPERDRVGRDREA